MNSMLLDDNGNDTAPERMDKECANRCGCYVPDDVRFCSKECYEEATWEDRED